MKPNKNKVRNAQVRNMSSSVEFELTGIYANVRTEMAIRDLFNNLDNIPVEHLEKFINQYKK